MSEELLEGTANQPVRVATRKGNKPMEDEKANEPGPGDVKACLCRGRVDGRWVTLGGFASADLQGGNYGANMKMVVQSMVRLVGRVHDMGIFDF